MALLKNRAGMNTATTGTGTVTLGLAVPAGTAPYAAAWQTFANAGVANTESVRYLILDSNGAWEYGIGTYTSAGTTLSRASGAMDGTIPGQKSSTGSLLSLSGTAQVFIAAVAEDIPPATIGQCYLSYSGGNLLLSPKDGNQLFINSAFRTIPDAGVTLSPSTAVGGGAVAATTLYYIYASWSGSAIAMEASTTAYAAQAGTGVKIKSGDATRTLVGMWSSAGAGAWSSIGEGVSYFNPVPKTVALAATFTTNTTSASLVEMASGNRLPFISFAGREATYRFRGRANSGSGSGVNLDLYLDNTASVLPGLITQVAASTSWSFWAEEFSKIVTSEIRHNISGYFNSVSGTLTVLDVHWSVTVYG